MDCSIQWLGTVIDSGVIEKMPIIFSSVDGLIKMMIMKVIHILIKFLQKYLHWAVCCTRHQWPLCPPAPSAGRSRIWTPRCPWRRRRWCRSSWSWTRWRPSWLAGTPRTSCPRSCSSPPSWTPQQWSCRPVRAGEWVMWWREVWACVVCESVCSEACQFVCFDFFIKINV